MASKWKQDVPITGAGSLTTGKSLPLKVRAGSPSDPGEDGSWSVNSKTYNTRIPFTIYNTVVTSAGHQVFVVVNTKELVDYDNAQVAVGASRKYFGGTTPKYQATVEFGFIDNDVGQTEYDCGYWCMRALGSVQASLDDELTTFNNERSIYVINVPVAMDADTTYDAYLYLDKDQIGISTNHEDNTNGNTCWDYGQDFDTAAANYAAFLAAYTDWEEDPVNAYDPTIVCADSVMKFTPAYHNQWQGIATKNTYPSGETAFISLSRIFYYYPGQYGWCGCGMMDADGWSQGHVDGNGILMNEVRSAGSYYSGFRTFADGSYTDHDSAIFQQKPMGPFWLALKYVGGKYYANYLSDWTGDPAELYTPDSWELLPAIDGADDGASPEAHKAQVFAYQYYVSNNATIWIDTWLIGHAVSTEPTATFPTIQLEYPGMVYLYGHGEKEDFTDLVFETSGGVARDYWLEYDNERTSKRHYGEGRRGEVTAWVEFTEDLSSGQSTTLVVKYGDSAASDLSDIEAAFSLLGDDFSDLANWDTPPYGSWATDDQAKPIFWFGGLWGRMPSVVEDGGELRMIYSKALWTRNALGWPCPFHIHHATAPDFNTEFQEQGQLIRDSATNSQEWPDNAKVIDGTCVLTYTGNDPSTGVGQICVATGSSWTGLTCNGSNPIWTPSSVNNTLWPGGGGGAGVSNCMSGVIVHHSGNGKFYLFYACVPTDTAYYGAEMIGVAECDEGSPLDVTRILTPGNWTDLGPVMDTHALGRDLAEDFDVQYDSGTSTWYLYSSDAVEIRQWSISDANFPGSWASQWANNGTITITNQPKWANNVSSPRLIEDTTEGNWKMYFYGNNLDTDSTTQRWVPNIIGVAEAADVTQTTWAMTETVKEYKQSTNVGHGLAITNDSFQNFEMTAVVCIGENTNEEEVGLAFDYIDNTHYYWVTICHQWAAYPAAQVVRGRIRNGAAVPFLFTDVPIMAGWAPGEEARLRVRRTNSNTIEVAYSIGGEPWKVAWSGSDSTHATNNPVGLTTWDADGYFRDVRVRPWESSQPYFGATGGEVSLLAASGNIAPVLLSAGVI